MGLWQKLRWPKKQQVEQPAGKPYATFSDSQPISVNFKGEYYEQELVRACIDRFASACSKLEPSYEGSASRALERMVKTTPNELMTWPQFLYRCATITEVDNNCAIVPGYAPDMQTITSIYPLLYESAEIVEYAGEPWVKFYTVGEDFRPTCTKAIELRKVCFVTRFQYESDIFGSMSGPKSTLDLIKAQENAQKAAIKNNAGVKWIGAVSNRMDEDDLADKRKRFTEMNLSSENESSMLVYDQTFEKVEQVKYQSYTLPTEEMERIENDVFTYYGTPKSILQNDYEPNKWAAWYEGKIEPWAVQVADGISRMFFTQRQMVNNRFHLSSQRLQYAAMAEKRNMIRDMTDRGIMSLNEGRDILQMAPIPNGDIHVIRGEYLMLDQVDMVERQHDVDKTAADLEKPQYDDLGSDTEDDTNTEA